MMEDPELDPIRNWTWEAMEPEDRAALRPHIQRRHLPRGDVLMSAEDSVDVVYFPVTADIANVVRLPDGETGMATTVGRDGLTGLAAFLADEPMGWDIQVQIEGYAWALSADLLRRRAEVSPALRALLLRLTHRNQVEAAVSTVCNLSHDTPSRLARWLLTTQDRTSLAEFKVLQQELADWLGVRRTTMVEACRDLGRQGAIRNRRGRISIIDRSALKKTACCCYALTARGGQYVASAF